MNDDKDFIDLDSTQNWSQLDVKKELDNLEVNKETGERYDFARGFNEDAKKEEEKILLDGLTSGLNYIPEEFLMAADEKHEEEMNNSSHDSAVDVSWAYRDASAREPEEEPFIPIAQIKQESVKREPIESVKQESVERMEQSLDGRVEEEQEKELRERERTFNDNNTYANMYDNSKQADSEVEALRQKNLEEQIAKHAQINASDEAVKANIEARKKAREEAAAAHEAIIKANAEAKKAAMAKAEKEMYESTHEGTMDMFSTQALDLDAIEVAVSTKEERIAASKKNSAIEEEEEAERPAKKKKATSAAGEYAAWADSDDDYVPEKKKKRKKHVEKLAEAEEEDEEEDEDDYYSDGFIGKITGFFKKLSGLDLLVAGTGVLVVLVAVITGIVYSSSKTTQNKVAEFVQLGEKMQTLGVEGSSQLVAVADARKALAEIEIVESEEEEKTEYEEKEEESTISVTMSLTSVKKDLKIKFINAKTKKLVGNHEFKVNIEDAKGKKYSATDEDMDGIIYLNSVVPGKAKVSMAELPDEKGITFSKETVTVTIKENLDYKKIDVSDEIKNESQINAKAEDTAAGLATEGSLKDTVEWVESTKTAVADGFVETTKSSITDPAKITPNVTKTAKAVGATPVVMQQSVLSAKRVEPRPYSIVRNIYFDEPSGDPDPDPGEDPDAAATNAAATNAAATDAAATNAAATAAADAAATNAAATAAADAEATNAAATNAAATNAAATNAVLTNAVATNAAATNAVATNAAASKGAPANATATAAAATNAAATNAAASLPKNDKTTPLKDKNGNQVYIKNSDGEYVEAKYADYYTEKKFYRKEVSEYKYTGWQVIDNETYFFDKNGNKVTGEQVIQGAKYNFDSTGALVKGSGTMGIDVSKWNGNINWTAVKNSGVSFVIIRCGYRGSSTGALVEDPKFKTNIKGATDAGLKVGIYFFSQAITDVEAVEEASMTIDLIKKYKISYPVFLDVEDSGGRGDKIDSNTRTQVIEAYCQTLKNSGYTAGVYANKSWLNNKMNAGALSGYKIWLAQYNTEVTYGGKYDMWQYSSKGSVNGISGNTDMNLSYLGY